MPAELRLRRVPTRGPSDRISRWWRRLYEHRSSTLQAGDLYVGDHWAIVKQLPQIAAMVGFRSSLWVASAGYGLIPAAAPIRSYSATFAPGHPDSVATSTNGRSGVEVARAWWTGMNGLPGPLAQAPRTIADLVRDDPRAYILVVASPDYVSALEDDLVAAVRESKNADRLLIVSSHRRFGDDALGSHVIPSDARFQNQLGGSLASLHARVARKILEESRDWELSAELLQARYRRILARSPCLPTFNRHRVTDAEVRRFIRTETRSLPEASCSSLLRSLRDSGRACEQARFKALFHQARARHHAS